MGSFKTVIWVMAALAAAVMTGCGGGDDAPATASRICDSGPACVNLQSAGTYVILAQSGISNTSASAVLGDIGVAPGLASSISGFDPLTMDFSNTFSTSPQVAGRVFASNYSAPTPNNLVLAVADSEDAFNDAGMRPANFTDPTAGNIGGTAPIAPGVYKWTTAVAISSDVTLSGTATDVWIFQIDGDLTQAAATTVALAGGALAKNVFWQVDGNVTLGANAHLVGVVLARDTVDLQAGASSNGRLFAGLSVAINGSVVAQP
jgi:hypothetical protein